METQKGKTYLKVKIKRLISPYTTGTIRDKI